ncbi:hypothetical protein JCM8547_000831 [Rhodosporidiobolus lusitaniae]
MLFHLLLGTVALGTVALADTTSLPSTVEVNGTAFTWKGAVAYGELVPTVPDLDGYSLGGLGSAIAVKRWRSNGDGTYSGTIVAQPDRGHNTVELENFGARHQLIEFTLRPCMEETCNTDAAAPSLELTYTGIQKYIDASPRNQNGEVTSGLDAVNIRPAADGFPVLPEVENGNNALSTDMEGIALMADGTFWSSDEYGPTIYHIGADGIILGAIMPPDAFLPHNEAGELDFSVESDIVSGRATNQGFEGLTINPDNTRLYALLQSALMQDQNVEDEVSVENTRMLVYDISTPSAPTLIEEYVVVLPKSDSKVFASSEVHYVKDGLFMVLARDGKGNGNGDSPSSEASKKQLTSNFKDIGLVSLAGATNIVGLYDDVGASVAPNGVLDAAVTPATFNEFINMIDDAQLARFGLHNGKPTDRDLVGKWEALAIAPVLDVNFPDDFFIFTAADNDFISTAEWVDGVNTGPDPYESDVPNAFFVYRVTLPGAEYPTYLLDQSLNPSGLARRRIPRSLCPGQSQCSLGGGRWECIDVSSNLEQCGACANDQGVDCTALPGVAGVVCVQGTCVVESCEVDRDLVDGACL